MKVLHLKSEKSARRMLLASTAVKQSRLGERFLIAGLSLAELAGLNSRINPLENTEKATKDHGFRTCSAHLLCQIDCSSRA